MIIQWKKGSRFNIGAETAFSAVNEIKEKVGDITSEILMEQVRADKNSPLHPEIFDCGERRAASRYYKYRAGLLLRSIEIIHKKAPTAPVRAFSVVTKPPLEEKDEPRKVYTSTEEALADPVMRDEILGNAIRDAIAFRRKYAALQELSQVTNAIDSFIANAKV